MINRTETDSTLIASQGYDPETRTLALQLTTATEIIYQFSPVPPEEYEAFLASGSLGTFFVKRIKYNPAYTMTKVPA